MVCICCGGGNKLGPDKVHLDLLIEPTLYACKSCQVEIHVACHLLTHWQKAPREKLFPEIIKTLTLIHLTVHCPSHMTVMGVCSLIGACQSPLVAVFPIWVDFKMTGKLSSHVV